MKNGSHFNKSIRQKLVIVNSNDQMASGQDEADDAAYPYNYHARAEDKPAKADHFTQRQTLLVFMAVSFACAAAAVATGSYAVWLSKHQATQQALTDVNDLLKTCKTRMEQLEHDVQHLPRRA